MLTIEEMIRRNYSPVPAGNTLEVDIDKLRNDLEAIKQIQESIQTLKDEIDLKAYFSFYTVQSMVEDGIVIPKIITRDEHLTMVYAFIISEFNKLSVFSKGVVEEEDSDGEQGC